MVFAFACHAAHVSTYHNLAVGETVELGIPFQVQLENAHVIGPSQASRGIPSIPCFEMRSLPIAAAHALGFRGPAGALLDQ
jgi:hypothetical protein